MQWINGLLLFALLLPGMRLPALEVLPNPAKVAKEHAATTQTPVSARDIASEGLVLSAVEEPAGEHQVRETYPDLPFYFIENQGQRDARVAYYAQQGGANLYFTTEEVVLALPGTVLRAHFVGANPDARVTGQHPQKATVSYFVGKDPEQWHNQIPTYSEVTYHDLYPGIDLTYTGRDGALKYTFVLQPGAEADGIRLAYAGAEKMRLAENGDLLITPEGAELSLRDTAPYVYQEIDGAQVPVAAAFKLYDDHTYGFTLGTYDPNIPLVIDPTLLYSTLLGGSDWDYGHAITLDDNGNVYVTGEVKSTDFPTTTGAYTTTYQGGTDVFVSVLSADLSTLRYSTFLGGAGTDVGRTIALDAASGDVYVTGDTFSDDFPTTTGAYTTTRPSGGTRTDVFLSVFSADLSTLSYSTFLGGYWSDYGHGIAIDDTGSAYITGYTHSEDFPTTTGAYTTTHHGGQFNFDVFVSVLDPAGNGESDLLYSTFLGGYNSSDTTDKAYAIALDSNHNIYVTGETLAVDFPTTSGAYTTTHHGDADVFVSVLDPAGNGESDLLYSTYLGGSEADISHDLALDSTGNVYIAGTTESSDFPVTAGAYDTTLNEDYYAQDTFVSVLDPTLSTLSASTFLGGSWIESAHDTAIALDSAGHVYVTGDTASGDFPTTSDAYTTTGQDGTPTVYLSVFSSNLAALSYATFIGAGFSESMAMDDQENVYIMGFTGASEYPTTPNAYMTTIQGGDDVFITKFGPAADLVIDKRVLPTTPISPGGAITYTLTFSNTGVLTATDVAITDHVPICVSVQSVISSGVAIIGTGANLPYVWDVADLASNDSGTIILTGVLSYPLAMGTFTNTATIATITPEGDDTNNRDEAGVEVPNVAPTADAGTPQMVDPGDAVALDGSGSSDPNGDPLTYLWQQTGGPVVTFTPNLSVTSFTAPDAAGVLTFTLTVTDTGSLTDMDEVVVTVTAGTPGYASLPPAGRTIQFGLDMGGVKVGATVTSTLTISETGNATLNITSLVLSGPNAADFSVSPTSFSIVDGGASQTVSITCTPARYGLRAATLTVNHNAAGSPATYTLNCTGKVMVYLPLVLRATP